MLKEQYGLDVLTCKKSALGAGSDTWFAECVQGKYVVKFPEESAMNHPEQEIALCKHLLKKGIPVSRFLLNRDGSALSRDPQGRLFHVQEFIEGTCYSYNTAPVFLLEQMPCMLGSIHNAFRDYPALPEGIGEGFFHYMTPERVMGSFENSLRIAKEHKDAEVEEELLYRIELLKALSDIAFSLSDLTCANTHGDYGIHQLLCADNRIAAVIDWTTACVHPLVWEIFRSFVYAAPSCKYGCIDSDEMLRYVSAYMQIAPLTPQDLSAMIPLFYRQIAVCDYYGQYYASTAANRSLFLHQARFSTKLLRYLTQNGDKLTQALLTLS